MIHLGKNTRSTVVAKGISAGRGQNTYRGLVESSEIQHAWQWARTAKHTEDAPVRVISPPTGIWKDYHAEHMEF